MWKILTLGAGFTLVASAAMAQPRCNERDNVLDLLAKKYQEIFPFPPPEQVVHPAGGSRQFPRLQRLLPHLE